MVGLIKKAFMSFAVNICCVVIVVLGQGRDVYDTKEKHRLSWTHAIDRRDVSIIKI